MSPKAGQPVPGAGDVGAAQSGVGGDTEDSRFRVTLVRVLVVQAVALALLWLLQAAYRG